MTQGLGQIFCRLGSKMVKPRHLIAVFKMRKSVQSYNWQQGPTTWYVKDPPGLRAGTSPTYKGIKRYFDPWKSHASEMRLSPSYINTSVKQYLHLLSEGHKSIMSSNCISCIVCPSSQKSFRGRVKIRNEQ